MAPSSTEGHFIEEAEKVVMLDDLTEAFFVKGKSKLVTKNHTTLIRDESCLVICQNVYNPLTWLLEKSKD